MTPTRDILTIGLGLEKHGGKHENIAEIVCDMSPSFLSAAGEQFDQTMITVDWFHVVKLFTDALEKVRRSEQKQQGFPRSVRWAVLKGEEKVKSDRQQQALEELETSGFATAKAFRIKEMLRWVWHSASAHSAKWRITHFIKHAQKQIEKDSLLKPVQRALTTFKELAELISRRWVSNHTNARFEGLNSLFQAAKSRARGYKNKRTFITMIYPIAAPVEDSLKGLKEGSSFCSG